MKRIDLSEEQRMLQETAQRYLRERYDFSHRSRRIAQGTGIDRAVWKQFAEMGWLGLGIDEADGGLGGGPFDIALLLETFGRALVIEPFVPTVAVSARVLKHCRDHALAHDWLRRIPRGEAILAFAHFEPQTGYAPGALSLQARPDGNGAWRLHGAKAVVAGAPLADAFIVTARETDTDRSALFLLEASAVGLHQRGYPMIDGAMAAELKLEGVRVDAAACLARGEHASALIEEAVCAQSLACCALGVGALDGAVDLTAEYLNARQQFDRKLASFQALRHRLADMHVLREECRALTRLAAAGFEDDAPDARRNAVDAAKAWMGESGRRVCEDAVQMHGAIAITDEYIVGHYLKKLIAIDRTGGDAAFHFDRFTRETVSLGPAATGEPSAPSAASSLLRPAVPVSGSYASPRPQWLAQHSEPILEPDLPIVDAHHHLWDRIGEHYMLEALMADVRTGHRIVATVYVDCRSMYRQTGPAMMQPLGEVEFANGVAAIAASGACGPTRVCDGIVGHADLRHGAAIRELLQAQVAAAGGRFKGIRQVSAHSDEAEIIRPVPGRVDGLLRDPAFREGFAQLAPLGLSFDAYLFHTQLGDLLDLARTFPGTPIMIDHVGTPLGVGSWSARRDEAFAQWKRSMLELARCPNVWVKLGGLGMRLPGFGFDQGERPPSSGQLAQAWHPYVDTCIQAFGPQRAMFESNFPPDKGSCAYDVLWNAFKRLAQGYTPLERALLFSGSACAFYRLDNAWAPR